MATFGAALGAAVAAGAAVDWAAACPGAVRVDLPTYPFQHGSYWHRPESGTGATDLGLDAGGHPLAGAAVARPDGVRNSRPSRGGCGSTKPPSSRRRS